jgi:hypothetical protein
VQNKRKKIIKNNKGETRMNAGVLEEVLWADETERDNL